MIRLVIDVFLSYFYYNYCPFSLIFIFHSPNQKRYFFHSSTIISGASNSTTFPSSITQTRSLSKIVSKRWAIHNTVCSTNLVCHFLQFFIRRTINTCSRFIHNNNFTLFQQSTRKHINCRCLAEKFSPPSLTTSCNFVGFDSNNLVVSRFKFKYKIVWRVKKQEL